MTADAPSHVHRTSRRRGRLNDRVALVLVVLLAMSPIPFGGNQLGLVPIYAGLIGLAAFGYGFSLWRQGLALAVPLKAFGIELALWSAVIAGTFLQIVPFPLLTTLKLVDRAGSLWTFPQISVAPGVSLLLGLEAVGLGLMFLLAAQLSTRESRARRLTVGLFAVNVAFAGWALLSLTQLGDTILGMTKWAYAGSATGTFVNRNTFATYSALGVALGCALIGSELQRLSQDANRSRRMLRLIPYLVGTALIFAALLSSTSRFGLLAGVAGASVVGLLTAGKLVRGFSGVVASIALTAAWGGILIWLYGGGVLDRLGSTEIAFDGRWELYRQTAEMIRANPWFGYGAGAFEYAFPLFHQAPVSLDVVWDKAHSMYLTMWVERGVVVGSLPAIALALVLARLLVQFFRDKTASSNNLAAIGALTVCGIHSILDFSLEIQAVAYLFSCIVGLGVGGLRQEQQRQGTE